MSKNLANDIGLLIDELGSNPSKDERSLSATKARQYFNFIFYWLEGGILKPNQNLDKIFFNFRDALSLRIKNILKRNSYINKVKPSSNLEFGPFFFNMDSLNLYKNGLSIHLTTSEQNLLKCFAKMPNKALSRDDLNKMLGGKMEDRSIDVAITRIRKKIEKDQRFPTYLQTIRGFGWKLNTFNSKEFENEA